MKYNPPYLRALLLLTFLFGALITDAQSWKVVSAGQGNLALSDQSFRPDAFTTLEFNRAELTSLLAQAPKRNPNDTQLGEGIAIAFPMPDGNLQRFSMKESSVFAPELAAKYSNIKSYTGMGIDDPTAVLKLSISPKGLNGFIYSANHGNVFIDPFSSNTPDAVMSYFKRDLDRVNDMACLIEDAAITGSLAGESNDLSTQATVGDCMLKTFRLALACTGEYAVAVGASTAGTTADTTTVMAEYNVAMTRVNGLYERDAGVTMELIANTDILIHFNGTTDPYTNNDGLQC